ncbi:tyrosine-type recombinase/integrase [Acetobacter sicerae]|uniref:Tyrosine-type recombinase/integrase n=1 Tax=Acetobacter sicerae TaxID=85325 RepID=A0ABS8VY69_9PROT|nr:tyrosine-type recombinase/integrase [Acetobacter sicerae]MCE0745068.1 tyrosine-type recombinase/integrase [Acetobacter sicerae]
MTPSSLARIDPSDSAAETAVDHAPRAGGGEALTPEGRAALAVARAAARDSAAYATLRAYRSDWAHFLAWCEHTGFQALPAQPAAIGAYLASLETDFAPSTIQRRLAAIAKAHRFGGFGWDGGHRDLQGPLRGVLRRQKRPKKQAVALRLAHVQRLVATCGGDAQGVRDRALLLVGFAAALRRSELVALRMQDLVETEDGLALTIRSSKTDQTGEGVTIGVPRGAHAETCPVYAVRAWRVLVRHTAGPLFRKVEARGQISDRALHPDAVRQILRKRAALAGFTDIEMAALSPHGLRAGFITEAYYADVPEADIREHVRHRDPRTTHGYIRQEKRLRHSPAGKVGL